MRVAGNDKQRRRHRGNCGKASVDVLLVGGLVLGWFFLQAFVLPGMGVST